MATNTNKQLINVFNKGMNTDTSDAYISSDQYREAVNLRFLMNNDSTTGELHTIEGWKDLGLVFYNVLATTSIRNYGIIIEGTPDGWNIWRWDKDSDIGDANPKKVFGPCEDPIGEKISLVTRWESDENIKLYIADGIHNLMSINIMDEDVLTDIKYLTGWYDTQFGKITTEIYRPGTIAAPVVQYAYILYNKYGFRSRICYITDMISLYRTENSHDSGMSVGNSGCGVKLSIDIINQNYNRISVYRILYNELGQTPGVYMIEDSSIASTNTVEIKDSGLYILTLSLAEFLALDSNVNITPKQIESKNDILFAANIEYSLYDEDTIDAYNSIDATAMSESMENNLDLSEKYDRDSWAYGPFDSIGYSGQCVSWVLARRMVQLDEYKHSDNTYKSLKTGEIYRYGLVLYDKYGNKFPVKWIADIRIPDEIPFEFNAVDSGIHVNIWYTGWKVDLGDRYNELFPKVQIVRCKRTIDDSSTICQGIVGNTFLLLREEDGHMLYLNKICPTGFLTLGTILTSSLFQDEDPDNKYVGVTNNEYILFFSPEISYLHDDVLNILDSNIDSLYLREVGWFETGINDITIQEATGNTDVELGAWYDNKAEGDISIAGVTLRKEDFKVRLDDIKLISNGLKFVYDYYDDPGHKVVRIDQANFFKSHPSGSYKHKYYIDYTGTNPEQSVWEYDTDSITNNYGTIPILNVIRPSKSTGNKSEAIDIPIQAYKYSESPEIGDFADSSGNFTYMNSLVAIGNKTFIKWSLPTMLELSATLQEHAKDMYSNVDLLRDKLLSGDPRTRIDSDKETYRYPIGMSGRCLIIDAKYGLHNIDKPFPISIYELRKTVTPYNGYSLYARNNSTYYAYSQPFDVNADLYTDTFDGDCFIQAYFCNVLHNWTDSRYIYAPKMVTVYIVPIETSIDMLSDYGDSYRVKLNVNIQENAVLFNGYVLEKNAYAYNTAYGSLPDTISFYGTDTDFSTVEKYDTRVIYSAIKTNGEPVDSWTLFQAANFIDVDTRFGLLTELRLFKDTLLFWQESATGVLSVNERTILQDANDTNIILGNGDVLQRYDYLTTEFGMKPGQFADALSNTTLYWWDGYKKDIVAYSGGQQVVPMKKVKTVNKYINENDECEKPALAYDSKYNEVLMNVVGQMPLAYSEITLQFTSLYNASFDYKVNFNDRLILVANDNFNEWNAGNGNLKPSLKYVVNDNNTYVKVYDNVLFGLGDVFDDGSYFYNSDVEEKIQPLNFTFKTKGLESTELVKITNREYDYRFAIPRNKGAEYADRLRGKTMKCELTTVGDVNSADFSIQYIITKYRISWS